MQKGKGANSTTKKVVVVELALPEETCVWCSKSTSFEIDESGKKRCTECNMTVTTVETLAVPVVPLPPLVKSRKSIERTIPFDIKLSGKLVIGVDPGSRYSAIVVRDADTVIMSSTIVRVGDLDPIVYARLVRDEVRKVREEFPDAPLGVEGVTDPKGFNRGKRAALNPKDIIRTATVAGALAGVWDDAIIIPPGGNGSQDLSQYPSVLKGRRPKDLPGQSLGAGTRRHEQSAFDVAGKTATIVHGGHNE